MAAVVKMAADNTEKIDFWSNNVYLNLNLMVTYLWFIFKDTN